MAIVYLKTTADTQDFRNRNRAAFNKIMAHKKKSTAEKKTKAMYSNQAKKERVKRCKDTTKKRKQADRSPAEKKIELFLMRNNVPFETEKYFPGLFNDRTNNLLYFDFYLPTYNVAIEFDGIRHYKAIGGDTAALAAQKHKDNRKNRFCHNRGILLLRISCFDKRNIEDTITLFFDKHFP